MVAETCRYLANVSRNPGLLDFLWAVSPSAPTLHNLKKIIFYGYLCILIWKVFLRKENFQDSKFLQVQEGKIRLFIAGRLELAWMITSDLVVYVFSILGPCRLHLYRFIQWLISEKPYKVKKIPLWVDIKFQVIKLSNLLGNNAWVSLGIFFSAATKTFCILSRPLKVVAPLRAL